jgi:hypothetical protein
MKPVLTAFAIRDVIGANWDAVLREFIPKVALARTRDEYQLELMVSIARVHDTHANLWSSLNVRPPAGNCRAPVKLRFIGDQAVVIGYADGSESTASTLAVGDIIETLDGVPVAKLVAQWTPYSRHRTNQRAFATSHARCCEARVLTSRCASAAGAKRSN